MEDKLDNIIKGVPLPELCKATFVSTLCLILTEMGISQDKIVDFVEGDITLGNLGICFDISEIIDNQMTEVFGDLYLGVMPRDTFKAILKYHDLEI